jgi:hypothetical protein
MPLEFNSALRPTRSAFSLHSDGCRDFRAVIRIAPLKETNAKNYPACTEAAATEVSGVYPPGGRLAVYRPDGHGLHQFRTLFEREAIPAGWASASGKSAPAGTVAQSSTDDLPLDACTIGVMMASKGLLLPGLTVTMSTVADGVCQDSPPPANPGATG